MGLPPDGPLDFPEPMWDCSLERSKPSVAPEIFNMPTDRRDSAESVAPSPLVGAAAFDEEESFIVRDDAESKSLGFLRRGHSFFSQLAAKFVRTTN